MWVAAMRVVARREEDELDACRCGKAGFGVSAVWGK
jgi:hypothetical protein